MQKIIGIRGHRGAGKESVAFLLAKSLEWMHVRGESNLTSTKEDFDVVYGEWTEEFIKDKDKAINDSDWKYVYLDAFGDAPKAMVQQLLGCDFKYLWDEYWKDHAVVDLRTFNIIEVDSFDNYEGDLVSPSYLGNYTFILNDPPLTQPQMTLRDFILYFGQTVMQRYFGQDVWVKSTAQNDHRNESILDTGYRIFKDIKAPTELSYVIGRGGVVVNVERKGRKKVGGLDLLKDDDRWDYKVSIKGDDLISIKDEIYKITKEIYENKI